eukprot:5244458-Prymnesium_polylepis.1
MAGKRLLAECERGVHVRDGPPWCPGSGARQVVDLNERSVIADVLEDKRRVSNGNVDACVEKPVPLGRRRPAVPAALQNQLLVHGVGGIWNSKAPVISLRQQPLHGDVHSDEDARPVDVFVSFFLCVCQPKLGDAGLEVRKHVVRVVCVVNEVVDAPHDAVGQAVVLERGGLCQWRWHSVMFSLARGASPVKRIALQHHAAAEVLGAGVH